MSCNSSTCRQRLYLKVLLQKYNYSKGHQSSHLLLVVGNDASHKVGLGLVECHHQFGQLFLHTEGRETWGKGGKGGEEEEEEEEEEDRRNVNNEVTFKYSLPL